jgi:DNA-binding transcriptional regulator LsrR (DeoR family)
MKNYETRKIKSLLAFHGITNRMIAQEAKVSETFVSYVINDKRKSDRVKRTIKEMVAAQGRESTNH